MKIIGTKFRKPPNLFISEIQQYCRILIEAPAEHRIYTLFDLKKLVAAKADEIGENHYCTTLEFLEFEVHSYLTFEIFNLLYDNDTILISVSARKTAFEAAFMEYDATRSMPLPPA